jgi:phage tail-like protein
MLRLVAWGRDILRVLKAAVMTNHKDPYNVFISIIQIDGSTVGGFSEVEALTSDGTVIDYREGRDEYVALRRFRDLRKFNNITFKHGSAHGQDLWNWWRCAREDKTQRKSGTIVLRNKARQPVLKLAFMNAWIRKWEGPPMNAKNNDVAIESLEIVCERIKVTS